MHLRGRDGFRFFSSGREKVTRRSAASVGMVTAFGGSSVPAGWLLCNGAEVARASYPNLAIVLGEQYGAYTNGSGSPGGTHFRLPDLQGRVPVGAGIGLGDGVTGSGAVTGGVLIPFQRGDKVGVETVTLSAAESGAPAHSHTTTVTQHTHPAPGTSHTHNLEYQSGTTITVGSSNVSQANGGAAVQEYTEPATIGAAIAGNTSGISVNNNAAAAAETAHANQQPFLVTTYIIKT